MSMGRGTDGTARACKTQSTTLSRARLSVMRLTPRGPEGLSRGTHFTSWTLKHWPSCGTSPPSKRFTMDTLFNTTKCMSWTLNLTVPGASPGSPCEGGCAKATRLDASPRGPRFEPLTTSVV
eukprot:7730509-Pyramimonas_sp.AAC.1